LAVGLAITVDLVVIFVGAGCPLALGSLNTWLHLGQRTWVPGESSFGLRAVTPHSGQVNSVIAMRPPKESDKMKENIQSVSHRSNESATTFARKRSPCYKAKYEEIVAVASPRTECSASPILERLQFYFFGIGVV
jgi:hypothetical protein